MKLIALIAHVLISEEYYMFMHTYGFKKKIEKLNQVLLSNY